MKYTVLLLFAALFISCSNKQENGIGFTIDPSIKNEVEKYIEELSESTSFAKDVETYNNSVYIENYVNDNLEMTTTDFSKKSLFKSFYYWHEGMLRIDGAFGLFAGLGFDIQIKDDKATLYHLLSSDDIPTYAYTKNDDFIFRLEVPCTDTKIVLSEIPDPEKQQIIYGYVEFKSADFYTMSNTFQEGKASQRDKVRNNMKVYFRSGFLKLK